MRRRCGTTSLQRIRGSDLCGNQTIASMAWGAQFFPLGKFRGGATRQPNPGQHLVRRRTSPERRRGTTRGSDGDAPTRRGGILPNLPSPGGATPAPLRGRGASSPDGVATPATRTSHAHVDGRASARVAWRRHVGRGCPTASTSSSSTRRSSSTPSFWRRISRLSRPDHILYESSTCPRSTRSAYPWNAWPRELEVAGLRRGGAPRRLHRDARKVKCCDYFLPFAKARAFAFVCRMSSAN